MLLRPPLVDVAIAAAFVAFTVAEALFTPGRRPVVAGARRRAGRGLLAWRRQAPIAGRRCSSSLVNVVTNPEAQFSTLLSLVLMCFTVGYETRPPRSYLGLADRGPALPRRQHRQRLRGQRPRRRAGLLRRARGPSASLTRDRADAGRGGGRPRRPARGRARARGGARRPGGAHPHRPRAARHRVPLDQRGDHPDPGRTPPPRPRPRARGRGPRRRRGHRSRGAGRDAAALRRAAQRRRVRLAGAAAGPVRARPARRAGEHGRHAAPPSASRGTPSS